MKDDINIGFPPSQSSVVASVDGAITYFPGTLAPAGTSHVHGYMATPLQYTATRLHVYTAPPPTYQLPPPAECVRETVVVHVHNQGGGYF
jgi:hypothetical protein